MASKIDDHGFEPERVLERYYRHKKATWVPECPPTETLLDYIGGSLDSEKSAALLEHLPFCDDCHALVVSFRLPMDDLEVAVEREGPLPWEIIREKLLDAAPSPVGEGALARPAAPHGRARIVPWGRPWIPPRGGFRWLAAAALIALTLSAAAGLRLYPSRMSVPAYVQSSSLGDAVRSPDAAPGDLLNKYYYLGVDALIQSQWWILQRVDESKVDQGIRYLEEAKKLAEAGQNQTYLAECYFHLGKAYLKKADFAQARRQFAALRALQGSSMLLLKRQGEAEQILKTLEE